MKQIAHSTFSIVVVAVCFLFLGSCRCGFYKCDNGVVPPETLIGQWQYLYYSGGFDGIGSNVTNQHWYLTLSDEGKATEQKNGTTVFSTRYSIYHADNNDSLRIIHFFSGKLDKEIYLNNDTLRLRDYQVDDGFEYLLVKRN